MESADLLIDLGAGYRPYNDGRNWLHLDANEGPDIEIVGEAERLCEYVAEGSCKELLARHLLEHFPYNSTVDILKEWHKALQEGGILKIEVPDLDWQAKALANGEITDEEAVNFIYGEQDYNENYHKAAFTTSLLAKRLSEAGFRKIKTWSVGQVVCSEAIK